MKIVVGLGNPGKEYENTKHNAGFMLVDRLVAKAGATWKENKRFKALTAEADGFFFIKPQTFMNNSGQAVSAILSYYKLLPKTLGVLKNKNSDLSEILTVIHDDIDIDLGKYKISIDSRAAGHNGVQSIIDHLKTKNFRRFRIGIKNEAKKMIPTEKLVLMNFDKEEKIVIDKVLAEIKL